MKRTITRRGFLGATGALALAGCATSGRPGNITKAYSSFTDDKTGVRLYNLTPGKTHDLIVYQTQPMWTPGMKHLVFMSEGVAHALELKTGVIRPVLESGAAFAMRWNSHDLYYLAGRDLFRENIGNAFNGKRTPVRVASLPGEYLRDCGGVSVDATGDTVYAGVVLEDEKRWGVEAYGPGGWKTLATVDFKIGHVQANPFTPGCVMFCWETGGDAPQRTWWLDSRNATPRPLYKETFNEWVTHEAWWGPDRVIFTIWPYDDEHKQKPHGVACTDLASGELNVLAQYPAWHTHGSPDGCWALGDDFERNIWLINMKTRERRLLTQGHLGAGFKTHPHGSFTPDSRSIIFNSSRSGSEDILLAPLPDWESLPKLK